MIAWVYARKSTEQNVSEEAKSVTRQIEHARACAQRKGWTIAEAHIYQDDGISGAEFGDRRPGLAALLNALPTHRCDVLIMSEESRLGREQFKVGFVLGQLADANIRVFYYLEDREAVLTDATGKFMEQVRNFAAEMEREKARQRTADALLKKARAGHVTGGRVFGYDNIAVGDHIERRPSATEAPVVIKIFQLYAAGTGLRGIAKHLNQDHRPAPRPSKGGPSGWSSLTIRDLIKRELYRGVVIYGKTKKRNAAGQKRQSRRPESDWTRVPVPALRIIPDELWQQVQQRRQQAAQIYLRGTGGKLWGKPASSVESHYLLTGMALCPCGAPLTVRSRSHGRKRAFYYVCRAHLDKGAVCDNGLWLPQLITDTAILAHLEGVLLHPDVIAEALRRLTEPDPTTEPPEQQRARLHRDLAQVERELVHFTDAIAAGGQIETVVKAIQLREKRRSELQAMLTRLDGLAIAPPLDLTALRPKISALLTDWKGLASKHVQATRQLLRKLLVGRITFSPDVAHVGVIRFTGEGTLAPIIGLLTIQGLQAGVAPRGFEPVFAVRHALS